MSDDRIDNLRKDAFDAIEGVRNELGEKVEKVHRRMFENNGHKAVVVELDDIHNDIMKANIQSGKALEAAHRLRKYCGLSESPAPGEGRCMINEVSELWSSIKRTAKLWAGAAVFAFVLIFAVSAWNGWTTHKQMTQVVKEFSELRAALKP